MAKNVTEKEIIQAVILGGVGFLVLRMLLKADEPRPVEGAGAILCERCSRNEPCPYWEVHRNRGEPS